MTFDGLVRNMAERGYTMAEVNFMIDSAIVQATRHERERCAQLVDKLIADLDTQRPSDIQHLVGNADLNRGIIRGLEHSAQMMRAVADQIRNRDA